MSETRPPRKFRPNAKRQLILVVLALAGLALGYGLGFLFKPEPAPAPAPAAKPGPKPAEAPAAPPAKAAAKPVLPGPSVVLPEEGGTANGPVRAYEEALPKEVVVTVERFGPEPTPAKADPPAAPVAEPPPAPPKPEEKPPAPVATARRPPPPAPEPPMTEPPVEPAPEAVWRKRAVASSPDGRPMIAIVIDDLGIDKPWTRRAVKLPGPLSMSFLTYASRLPEQTAQARAAGHELWMHVPMEPSAENIDPGPNVLLSGLDGPELQTSLTWNLDQFDHYVGINNHMGSRFTADLAGMRQVMKELKARGLAFLDSVTSGRSAGRRAAAEAGVAFAIRNVFIDHLDDLQAIRGQLKKIENLARRQGHAVAIGHPREKTLKALEPWLAGLAGKGFQLVPVSALLKVPAPPKTAKAPPG